MKKISVALLCLSLTSCATTGRSFGVKVGGALGASSIVDDESIIIGGMAYAADGFTVIVYRLGKGGRPEFVSGLRISCVASNPKRRIDKITDSNGAAHFSIRGQAQFWVEDDLGKVHTIANAAENSDTLPNQGYIEYELE